MKKLLCLALTVVMIVFCASFLNFSVCAAETNIVKYDFESFNVGSLPLNDSYEYNDGVMYFKINNPAVDQGQGVGASVVNDSAKQSKVVHFKGNATNHCISFKLGDKLKAAYEAMNLATIKVTVSFDYKGMISAGTDKALAEVKLFDTLGRVSTDLESTHSSKKNWRIGYLEKTVNVWHHFEGSFLLSASDYAKLSGASPDLYRVQFDRMNASGGEFYIDNFVVTANDPSATPVPTVKPTAVPTAVPTATPTATTNGNGGVAVTPTATPDSNQGGDGGSTVQPPVESGDAETGANTATSAPEGATAQPDTATDAPDGTVTNAPDNNVATAAPENNEAQSTNVVVPIIIGVVVVGGAVAGFAIYKKKKQN